MASSLYRRVMVGLTAVMLAGLSLVSTAGDKPAGAGVDGSAKADSLQSCVKPTDWMRRNHMELVKHSRHATVRQGIRIKDDSLANCVDCHVRKDKSGAPVPVNASGEFCNGCHSYTAVDVNCFQCHATVPDTVSAQR